MEKLSSIELPKWPQCCIWGEPITKEQALEIIRRTDMFFEHQFGNNHSFVEEATKILGIPQREDYKNGGDKAWDAYDAAEKEWRDKWQFISLEYLYNDWVSCSWVGGPHGWCHPDGTIGFQNNIGKWPHAEEVLQELQKIAEAFPFLKMSCTLMSREETEDEWEKESVVSFRVENGKAFQVETIPKDKVPMVGVGFSVRNIFDHSTENYFPLQQIRDWHSQVFKNSK